MGVDGKGTLPPANSHVPAVSCLHSHAALPMFVQHGLDREQYSALTSLNSRASKFIKEVPIWVLLVLVAVCAGGLLTVPCCGVGWGGVIDFCDI